MKKDTVTIGSRGSQLALWQAEFVKNELLKFNKNLNVEIKIIKTKGDKILDVALSKIGDKGLFTKELENELLSGKIDIAVHSLKDLQTEIPNGLKLAAVTKRHNPQDVLIARKKNIGLMDLKENAVVATGSLRRKSQILHFRPDIKIEELRGNVPTRIEKFLDSKWDAIILAGAGVERLGLKKWITSYIPFEMILPAVGQGALGIEINAENTDVNEILKNINDETTLCEVTAERTFLKRLEGGCQIPIGALGLLKSNGLYLSAYVGSEDGATAFYSNIRGKKSEPELLGIAAAEAVIKAGADEVLSLRNKL